MTVKDILTEINKIEILQDKMNNKEELSSLDLSYIGAMLIEYRFILENKEIKDDAN